MLQRHTDSLHLNTDTLWRRMRMIYGLILESFDTFHPRFEPQQQLLEVGKIANHYGGHRSRGKATVHYGKKKKDNAFRLSPFRGSAGEPGHFVRAGYRNLYLDDSQTKREIYCITPGSYESLSDAILSYVVKNWADLRYISLNGWAERFIFTTDTLVLTSVHVCTNKS
ncbi:hypothetical protein RRG08_062284 [Elysia crispata]|uniref:Uncharacterized protein n=1 Tax=Elysia crispata TaxID=231223 RepID=A0AAE1CYS2_9GAST|nr:hypothetical protein RRG08_062284 [Elysia crispata]